MPASFSINWSAVLSPTSANVAPGIVVSADTTGTYSPGVSDVVSSGVAMTPGGKNQAIQVVVGGGFVPNSVTGLGAGSAGYVTANAATGVMSRVASPSVGSFIIGVCNARGDLLVSPQTFGGLGSLGSLTMASNATLSQTQGGSGSQWMWKVSTGTTGAPYYGVYVQPFLETNDGTYYDNTYSLGFNFDNANTAEPSAGLALESNFANGTNHNVECYFNFARATSLGAALNIRPFGVLFNRNTGTTYVSFAIQGSAAGANYLYYIDGVQALILSSDGTNLSNAFYPPAGAAGTANVTSTGTLYVTAAVDAVLKSTGAGSTAYVWQTTSGGSAVLAADQIQFRPRSLGSTQAYWDSTVTNGRFLPNADNTSSIGVDAQRWGTVRAATAKAETFTLATALTSTYWATSAPTDVNTALNRLAAAVYALRGNVAIP